MPKYIYKIFRKAVKGLTLRDLELLVAWVKNTDAHQIWYGIISGIEVEIAERKEKVSQ